MTENEIDKSNSIIAKFMNWNHYPKVRIANHNVYGGFDDWDNMHDVWVLNPTKEFRTHLIMSNPEQVGLDIDFELYEDYQYQLQYNKSWDWLMPVVEKINNIDDIFISIHHNKTIIINTKLNEPIFISEKNNSMIGNTYLSVVKFINMYNK